MIGVAGIILRSNKRQFGLKKGYPLKCKHCTATLRVCPRVKKEGIGAHDIQEYVAAREVD